VREAEDMFHSAGLLEVHVAGEQVIGDERRAPGDAGPEEIIYQVPDQKRLALDLSKNIIIHFFVPVALLATAILMPPGPLIAMHVLEERGRRLSQLFKHEFIYDADRSFEDVFHDTVQQMIDARVIEVDEDDMVGFGEGSSGLDGRAWVVWYASMIRNFLESYRVAARGLRLLLRGNMGKKEWIRKAPLNLVFTAIYERTTDYYGTRGIRYVHMEAGHVAQNIYLQAEALGLGTVSIGAFYDDMVREVLSLPRHYIPLYIMPVGKR
jgi:glycerol-3-phosphate O-acyltransferase